MQGTKCLMHVILMISLMFTVVYTYGSSCPDKCRCNSPRVNEVICHSKYVPAHIPAETVALTLSGLEHLNGTQSNQSLIHLKNLTISNDTFDGHAIVYSSFRGFDAVQRLVLSKISCRIDKSAFRLLRNIRSITFDRILLMNITEISQTLVSVNNETFREVHIHCDGPTMARAEVLDISMYKSYEHLNLTTFSIISCSVAVMRSGFSKYLSNLQYVNITYNYISGDKLAVVEIMFLRHIVSLDMSYQHISYIPGNTPVEANTWSKQIESKTENGVVCIPMPPKLTTLYCRHTFGNINWISTCIDKSNSLKYLDISDDYLFKPTSPMVGFHSLEFLGLQNLKLMSFPLNMFHDIPMLRSISLGNNPINEVIESDTDGTIFRNNTRLISLDMAHCSIRKLSITFMCSIRGIEQLHLQGNKLVNINLTCLNQLQFINISSNRLNVLSENFIQPLIRMATKSNITLDITNNPLSTLSTCCDVSSLIDLHKNENVTFFGSDQYTCILDSKIKHFHELAEDGESWSRYCNPSTFSNSFIIVVVLVLIALVTTTLSVLVYRRRWCIRAYVLAGKRYVKRNIKQQPSEKFIFDAFVAYHESDSSWVRKVLLYHMETIHKFHLCIHERNFIPGEPIEENISNAIEISRRVILVISDAFFTSNWCMIEMRLARQMALDRGHDILIPIILQHVDASKGNKTLFNILNQNTYLEWPHDDREGQAFFIQRLSGAMNSYMDELVTWNSRCSWLPGMFGTLSLRFYGNIRIINLLCGGLNWCADNCILDDEAQHNRTWSLK